MEHLDRPYFVYGTLRPGYGNAKLWQSAGAQAAFDGRVRVRGFQMRASGIPFAIRTDDERSEIVGALIYPPYNEGMQRWLRYDLDSLEGHPHLYERQATRVYFPDAFDGCHITAWIYAMRERWGDSPIVPSGDYHDVRRPCLGG